MSFQFVEQILSSMSSLFDLPVLQTAGGFFLTTFFFATFFLGLLFSGLSLVLGFAFFSAEGSVYASTKAKNSRKSIDFIEQRVTTVQTRSDGQTMSDRKIRQRNGPDYTSQDPSAGCLKLSRGARRWPGAQWLAPLVETG